MKILGNMVGQKHGIELVVLISWGLSALTGLSFMLLLLTISGLGIASLAKTEWAKLSQNDPAEIKIDSKEYLSRYMPKN